MDEIFPKVKIRIYIFFFYFIYNNTKDKSIIKPRRVRRNQNITANDVVSADKKV